jgi:hypothetical protein
MNSSTGGEVAVSASIVPLLQSVLKSFNLYATLLIVVPGLLLNLVAFLVFLRKKFWKRTTMGFYYCTSSGLSFCCCAIAILLFLPAAFSHDFQLTYTQLTILVAICEVHSGHWSKCVDHIILKSLRPDNRRANCRACGVQQAV